METLEKRLRKLRTENNLTQEDLAQRLHVTRQAVSSWETGKTAVGIEYLVKLGEIYGVSVDELLYGERAAEPETYSQNQQKYVICAGGCIGVLLICALLNITVKPRLMQLYYAFVFRPYILYRHIVPAVMGTAAGVLLPAAVSLHQDIRLWGRWRRLAQAAGVFCLLIAVLGVALFYAGLPGFAEGTLRRILDLIQTVWWKEQYLQALFFLGGGCFFLGLNR